MIRAAVVVASGSPARCFIVPPVHRSAAGALAAVRSAGERDYCGAGMISSCPTVIYAIALPSGRWPGRWPPRSPYCRAMEDGIARRHDMRRGPPGAAGASGAVVAMPRRRPVARSDGRRSREGRRVAAAGQTQLPVELGVVFSPAVSRSVLAATRSASSTPFCCDREQERAGRYECSYPPPPGPRPPRRAARYGPDRSWGWGGVGGCHHADRDAGCGRGIRRGLGLARAFAGANRSSWVGVGPGTLTCPSGSSASAFRRAGPPGRRHHPRQRPGPDGNRPLGQRRWASEILRSTRFEVGCVSPAFL